MFTIPDELWVLDEQFGRPVIWYMTLPDGEVMNFHLNTDNNRMVSYIDYDSSNDFIYLVSSNDPRMLAKVRHEWANAKVKMYCSYMIIVLLWRKMLYIIPIVSCYSLLLSWDSKTYV